MGTCLPICLSISCRHCRFPVDLPADFPIAPAWRRRVRVDSDNPPRGLAPSWRVKPRGAQWLHLFVLFPPVTFSVRTWLQNSRGAGSWPEEKVNFSLEILPNIAKSSVSPAPEGGGPQVGPAPVQRRSVPALYSPNEKRILVVFASIRFYANQH